MKKISMKKTLNLHKYSIRVEGLISNWKFILPIAFSLAGIVAGSCIGKGEREVYKLICEYAEKFFLLSHNGNLTVNALVYFLVPSVFAFLIFFCGLSVYGGFVVNSIPFVYSSIIGSVTYYLYSSYTLKGLAYCVIIIFPYAVTSLFSLILLSCECINMSQVISKSIGKKMRGSDYNFTFYYKNCLKSYSFILLATVLKLIMDSLFIGLFDF